MTHDQIANAAASATKAAEAGVVITTLHGEDPEFCIWSIRRDGRVSEHRLNAACTDLARLTAHADGFVRNHIAHWAAA